MSHHFRKEAYLWEKLQENKVKCLLCQHRCLIKNGESGICQVRKNEDGVLYTLVYGRAIAKNIDPIEKKPLFHFYPGSQCLSIATVGCNFKCPWCQNWQISQMVRDHKGLGGEWFPPEDVVSSADQRQCVSISYTYTEPTIFFEYAYDTAVLAVDRGIHNNFVSNGYMTPEAIEKIKPFLHAINVDLKAFSEDVYTKLIGARLDKVMETIRALHQAGIWIEVTTLLIPDLNDDERHLNDLAAFLASVDVAIPWHITRFHPDYRHTNAKSTTLDSILRAADIGKKHGIRYVYAGNVPGEKGESTYCYNCGTLLIERWGFSVLKNMITKSSCPNCGVAIDGVGL